MTTAPERPSFLTPAGPNGHGHGTVGFFDDPSTPPQRPATTGTDTPAVVENIPAVVDFELPKPKTAASFVVGTEEAPTTPAPTVGATGWWFGPTDDQFAVMMAYTQGGTRDEVRARAAAIAALLSDLGSSSPER